MFSISKSRPKLLQLAGQHLYFMRIPRPRFLFDVFSVPWYYDTIRTLSLDFSFHLDGSDFLCLRHISFLYFLPCWTSPLFYTTSCTRQNVSEGSPHAGSFRVVITGLLRQPGTYRVPRISKFLSVTTTVISCSITFVLVARYVIKKCAAIHVEPW
jgi:hypothetical protein